MSAEAIQGLLQHMLWADDLVAESLRGPGTRSGGSEAGAALEARELYAHVLGAEEVWLARIRGTAPGPVWPGADPGTIEDLRAAVRSGYVSLSEELTVAVLRAPIPYVNSIGQTFESRLSDILYHVFLHGAYHRGQVALLLRKAGLEPAPSDYIGFVRGTPAATRTDRRGGDA